MSKARKIIDRVLEGYADDPTGANMMSMNVEDAEDAEKSPDAEDAAKNQFPVEKDEDAVFPVDDKDVELKKLPPGIKSEDGDELDLPGTMDKEDEDPKAEPEEKKETNESEFGGFDKEGLNQLISKAISNAVDQVIKTDWAKLYPVQLKALPPGVKSEDAPEDGLPTLTKTADDKEEPKKADEDGEEMGMPFAGEEEDDELSLPKKNEGMDNQEGMDMEDECPKKEDEEYPVNDPNVELKKLPPGIKYEDDEEKSDKDMPVEDPKDCPMDKSESAKWDTMVAKLKKEGYGDKAAARISGYIKSRKGK